MPIPNTYNTSNISHVTGVCCMLTSTSNDATGVKNATTTHRNSCNQTVQVLRRLQPHLQLQLPLIATYFYNC